MGRILKFLFTLVVLGAIGLIGYAYIGPYFGADFSAPQTEIRQQIELDGT